MAKRFRLLPLVIFVTAFTVPLKLGAIWYQLDGLVLSAAPAVAQQNAPKAAKSGDGKEAAKKKPAKNGAKKKFGRILSEKSKNSWFDPTAVTDAELQVLQNLSERRKRLEKRSSELDMREGLLIAAEKRIDSKIAELGEIQGTINDLLKKHEKQQNKQIKSVVKIYEQMKPKDAARIFEQLDMAILLDLVERMRESRTAPIMANMSPGKAKAMTAALAQRRALPKPQRPNGP